MLQLNGTTTYPLTGRTANQLATYEHIGLLDESLSDTPAALPALPRTDNSSVDLNTRARAYLHSNCASCHRPGGVGVGQIDFRFSTNDADMGVCNVTPTQDNLGVSGARLLKPGDPASSLLTLRMNRRGTSQMPPIGSNVIDADGVALIEDWIRSMNACP